MKIRSKAKPDEVGQAGDFNVASLNEIFVYFEDWMDTDFITNYDVFLETTQQWKDLAQAFKEHDVIVDNYNTCFFEPKNEHDKAQGYAP